MAFKFKFLKNIRFEFSVLCTQASFIGSSSGGTVCLCIRTMWYLQFVYFSFSFIMWWWWLKCRAKSSYHGKRLLIKCYVKLKILIYTCYWYTNLNPATFVRHRHPNPSGIQGFTDHVISQPQLLHCTSLRSRPTTMWKCIASLTKQVREDIPVRTTVFPQHRTSIWRTRNERHLLQAFFIVRYNFANFLHHYMVAIRRTL